MNQHPLTVTVTCQPLPSGRVEASFESPHVPFPLTTVADNLSDIELVVSEIVSALADLPADAITIDLVLDLNAEAPRATP